MSRKPQIIQTLLACPEGEVGLKQMANFIGRHFALFFYYNYSDIQSCYTKLFVLMHEFEPN